MRSQAVIERYGKIWPAGQVNDLSIELACYAFPEKYKTEHSPEFHFKNAFKLVWPHKVFQWNDWVELMCWAWCNYRVVTCMGHTRAGKTFNVAHFTWLDYLAAPDMTSAILTTTKFDSLKSRLWGDLLIAYNNSTQKEVQDHLFKVTSTDNQLKIVPRGEKADEKFLIQGVAVDRSDAEAGKLRGLNTERRILVGDEAESISDGFYVAMEHGMGAPTFHGWALTNPVEKNSKFGGFSEPKAGWGSITDSTLHWETKYGICLHLDGRQSPNIRAGRVINRHLMTQEYLDTLDVNTKAYWMLGVGFFAPDGMVDRIWSSSTIEKAKPSAVFDNTPERCATLDPAFEGDDCVLHLGDLGTLRDGKKCISGVRTEIIKTVEGAQFHEKDYQIAEKVQKICVSEGVKPENFIMDQTGNARGVFAILAKQWSEKIKGVYYGGKATERPLRLNDPLGADHQVRWFVSELWFRASFLAREGMLCGLRNLHPNTIKDLETRLFETVQDGEGKRMVVEPKKELKERLGRSPDFGDAASQFGELMVMKGYLSSNPVTKTTFFQTNKQRAKKAAWRFREKGAFSY